MLGLLTKQTRLYSLDEDHWSSSEGWAWDSIKKWLLASNMLLFVAPDLHAANFPWLADALADPDTTIFCTAEGGPRCITISKGTSKRHIVPLWSGVTPDLDGLRTLRTLFDYCGVGDKPTPGSLAKALMFRAYREAGYTMQDAQTRPALAGVDFIKAHAFGARNDTPRPGHYKEVYELDMTAAYLRYHRKLPGGTACYKALPGEQADAVTWFRRCEIFMYHPVDRVELSPIPFRNDSGLVHYGYPHGDMYSTWLWKEEADAANDMDCFLVQPHEGWYWTSWANTQAPWCDLMWSLRANAPTPAVQKLCKLLAVAGVGRFGMWPIQYTLVSPDEAEYGDIPVMSAQLADGEYPNPWYVRPAPMDSGSLQPQWWSYTVMQCNLALWEMARRFGEHVLATNTDAVYLDCDPAFALFDTANTPGPGSWTITQHTNATIGVRSIVSDQTRKQPGVKRG